jgi:nucleoside 2-deoxyribosyltransferase
MKCYIICPVRDVTTHFAEGVEAERISLEKQGWDVYYPPRDTKQNRGSLEICEQNLKAIKEADTVFFTWDGRSQGCLFDLGIAFALHKYIFPITGCLPRRIDHKSIQNFVWEYAEQW